MALLFVGFLFAVFSAAIASSKGRDGFWWFFIGLCTGPFGLLVGLMPAKVPATVKQEERRVEPRREVPPEPESLAEEKLTELTRLAGDGRISLEEYNRRRREIMSASLALALLLWAAPVVARMHTDPNDPNPGETDEFTACVGETDAAGGLCDGCQGHTLSSEIVDPLIASIIQVSPAPGEIIVDDPEFIVIDVLGLSPGETIIILTLREVSTGTLEQGTIKVVVPDTTGYTRRQLNKVCPNLF